MTVRIITILILLTLKLSAQDCATDSLGRKHGPCTEVLDKEFKVREGNYVDGKLHGPYIVRYTWDKGPLVIARGSYTNGQKHGLVTEYDVSGRISSTWPYEDGLLHGVVTRYSKGRVLTVESYERGIANGLWQTFHKNGKPKTYFYCKEGVFGPVHHLDKHGKVFKVIERKKRKRE